MSLPDGTGLDVVPALRALHVTPPHRPVAAIPVSGLGMSDDVRASLQAGLDQHLTKPISFEALLHAVDEFMAA
jgi:two-component system CheB/CheR fusion protein